MNRHRRGPRRLSLSGLPLLLAAMSIVIGALAVDASTRGQGNGPSKYPLVSVIMPTYERPELLDLALEQAGRSSYEGPLEIVVVDDSKEAIAEPEDYGHRLVYRHLDRRANVGEKRNMACALSKGEVVIMMDDDDIYHPDRIAYQVDPIMKGMADLTVLKQDVWLQLYSKEDGRESQFFKATPRMAKGVHYGTLAFRREVWTPELGMIYTDANLLDEVDFYNRVKEEPGLQVLELPNIGMHVYVRHPTNINRPGTDLARDRRFVATSRPPTIPEDHVARLERIVSSMHSSKPRLVGSFETRRRAEEGTPRAVICPDGRESVAGTFCGRGPDRADCLEGQYCYIHPTDQFAVCCLDPAVPNLPSVEPIKCGACIDANGLGCITADQCWDSYNSWEVSEGLDGQGWDACMEASNSPVCPAEDCEDKSSDEVCGDRCVRATGCTTLEKCYDMYSNYEEVDCDRFPSCDCGSIERFPTYAPTRIEDMPAMCGACIYVNGPCVSADECWDMYSTWHPWDSCMVPSGISGPSCTGCRRSSDEICEGRCVNINGLCRSLDICFDMYANYPEVDCDRFPTCDCAGPEETSPTIICPDRQESIAGTSCGGGPGQVDCAEGQYCFNHTEQFAVCCPDPTKCGACVDVNGLCVTADECWDMYRDSDVWGSCMVQSGISGSSCSGCRRSPNEICESRCVDAGDDCKSMEDCFDMYADYPDIDCDRFHTCKCTEPVPAPGTTTTKATSSITTQAAGTAIICPDGRESIAGTFCGRGLNRANCAEGQYCFIDPTDRFAVCCLNPLVTDPPRLEFKCCDPAEGPGGCPDASGSFDNCWDEGGYCCSDGKWYANDGGGGNNCQDNGLTDSKACQASTIAATETATTEATTASSVTTQVAGDSVAPAPADAWEYRPLDMPVPLSDMGLSLLDVGSGVDGEAEKRFIITGGCDSPEGNQFVEYGYFSCSSLSSKTYEFYPLRITQWKILAEMPRKRARHASVVVNGDVCIFGGRDEVDMLVREVDCYNRDTDTWTTPFNLPEKYQSSDLSAVSLDGKIYLIGGYDMNYVALDQVTIIDMSDVSEPTYADGPKLLEKRGDIASAVINGHIYVSGGFTHENDYSSPLKSVEKFSAETEIWSYANPLNKERGDHQLVALDGKLYALGGEDKVDVEGVPYEELPELGAQSEILDSVEVLQVLEATEDDPNTNIQARWSERPMGMPAALFRFAASGWKMEGDEGGYMFVFGGQSSYDGECKCFRTLDSGMLLYISHKEQGQNNPTTTTPATAVDTTTEAAETTSTTNAATVVTETISTAKFTATTTEATATTNTTTNPAAFAAANLTLDGNATGSTNSSVGTLSTTVPPKLTTAGTTVATAVAPGSAEVTANPTNLPTSEPTAFIDSSRGKITFTWDNSIKIATLVAVGLGGMWSLN